MGIVYQGPYAHKIGDYEGRAAQLLADGTYSRRWLIDETAYECHEAACQCGWRGNRYPAGPRGEELALDEWDRAHLRPLINAEARQHSLRADRLLLHREHPPRPGREDRRARPARTHHAQPRPTRRRRAARALARLPHGRLNQEPANSERR